MALNNGKNLDMTDTGGGGTGAPKAGMLQPKDVKSVAPARTTAPAVGGTTTSSSGFSHSSGTLAPAQDKMTDFYDVVNTYSNVVPDKPVTTPTAAPVTTPTTAPVTTPAATPTKQTADPNAGKAVAYDADGNTYYIGSDRGLGFLNSAENGSQIIGADGSTWTKNPNGTVTIADKNGRVYTIQGTSVNGYSAPASSPARSVPQVQKVDYFGNGRAYLDEQKAAAEEQIRLQNQYAVEQGVNELQRAQEDAQQQFQTQRNQVSRDEQIALDNQALYSEARGDKGGIGAAQYAAIQAQAAQNRLAVNQQQTKLATDTARQIADLRAQGEFKTADELLSLTQTYLGQLQQLYVNAEAYSLDVDRFNIQLAQWDNEFAAQVAQLTGTYNGNLTLEAQKTMASTAVSMLQSGVDIGPQQRAAVKQVYGLTDSGVNELLMKGQLKAKGASGSYSGSTASPSTEANSTAPAGHDALYLAAMQSSSPSDYIKAYYKEYGLTKQPSDNAYKDWMENENNIWYFDPKLVSDTAKHERDKLLRGTTLAGALSEEKLDYIYSLFSAGKIDVNERNWLLSEAGLVEGA